MEEISSGRKTGMAGGPTFLVSFLAMLVLSISASADLLSDGQPPNLPQIEVEALRQIGIKLRKDEKDWNMIVNKCNTLDQSSDVSIMDTSTKSSLNQVRCNCSFESSICHVITIQLTRQNLSGILPEEMANLTYLKYLDLSRNYLNGPIPPVWASLPLFNLSLQGNRISGNIPKELGSMPSIKSLQFENNQLEGPLPVEIGNLVSLERLLISANNIMGELPTSFGKLTNMTDFRIDGTGISGKIPDFIQNWRRLNRIDMVGTSMVGPIPASISFLRNLTEMRVSDLNGPGMKFPELQNAEYLTELVLRNCSISGEIPSYLGNMMYLKVLDLSFNELTGQIPSNFSGLVNLEYLYLTNNALTGEIPSWMLRNEPSNKINMDISYNNFSGSAPSDCQEGNVNLVSSFSSTNDITIPACLRKNLPCSTKPQYSSLFINCGGQKFFVEGNVYDDDSSQIGTSTFHLERSGRWAYSSTGDFTGNQSASYIATNTSILNVTYPDLYKEARLTPISLKYYGLCLKNGNYSVKLHFAEITFTNDKTYWSLGKRIFNVLIQGKNVLTNFNIKERAGRSGRAVIMNFTVPVTDNTLEIHLYWAGKGTTAIPERGIYGPLISAISATRSSDHGVRLPIGASFGIIVAFCLLIMFIMFLLWKKRCFHRLGIIKSNFNNLEMQPHYHYSLKEIEVATRNFDPAYKIGEGGFGPVFKGMLADGTQVAVKQLSPKSTQGNREFLNEIGMVSALQHPNLVKLFGCCIEGNQLLLIYEYMENNNLGRAIFGKEGCCLKLDWQTRFNICLGVAKGLAFLHEESRLRIVHRDIKATNILLDKKLNPKISDFGLAKLDEKEKTHISTRIAGTIGYMAPEYATRGYLTDKADVYSFGIVVLEVVSGKSNTNCIPNEEFFHLLDWALILLEQGKLLELVDPKLGSDYSLEEALRILNVSLLCTSPSPSQRPSMSTVVGMLAGETPVPDPVRHNSSVNEEWTLGALKKLSHSQECTTKSTAGQSSTNPPNISTEEEIITTQDQVDTVESSKWATE